MKGFFLQAGKEFVIKQFGEEIWKAAAKMCEENPEQMIMPFIEVADEKVICIAEKVSLVTGKLQESIMEDFGQYWISEAALKMYGIFYKNSNSLREFLLEINNFHSLIAKNTPGSHPPLFEHNWEDENILIIKYKSPRKFFPIAVGCVKGAVKVFKEQAIVSKIPPDQIKIKFYQ